MKKYVILLSGLTIFFACGKTPDTQEPTPQPDPDPKPVENPMKVNFDFLIEHTKASDTSFETGDVVGLYMVYGEATASSNYVNNLALTYDGSAWNGESIYWKDSTTPANFYAFSPRAAVNDMKAWTFRVHANQAALSDYKASDLIWGSRKNVSPTDERISLTTAHILSNLSISVVPGDGFTAEELAAANVSVEIMSIKTAATVDLATGAVAPTGDTGSVVPYNVGSYWRAVVVPQTVAEGSQLIVVKVNGEVYTLRQGFTFVAGKKHACIVTVKKSSSGISIGLGDWETGDGFSGDAQ
jgi:hypothetical protein